MKNAQIRDAAKQSGVKLWEIADRLGLTDCSFSRKLRRELPDDLQARVLSIIGEIASERGEG